MSEYPTFEEMNNEFILASKELDNIYKNSNRNLEVIRNYFSKIRKIQTKIDAIPEDKRSLALNLLKSMIDISLASLASVLEDNQQIEELLILAKSNKINSSNIDRIHYAFADFMNIKVPGTKTFWVIEEIKAAFKDLWLGEPTIDHSTNRVIGECNIDDFSIFVEYILSTEECRISINKDQIIAEKTNDIYTTLSKAIQHNKELDLRVKAHRLYKKGIG